MPEGIGLIGNGGHADEVESYAEQKVIFRAVSREYIGKTACIDIVNPGDFANYPVHLAVGAPAIRKKLEGLWPGDDFMSIQSKNAYVDRSVIISEGCMVAPGSVITTNVKLGRHVIINVGASVQHNSEVGQYTTISPGVRVAGDVTIGDGVFLGIGSTISNGVNIAPGVVVGAGAVLLSDALVENGVYVGIPARLIKINEGWLREI